ncbi:uncharacterized protein LOC130934113 [Arachis stenosperma]|uniref:uncharacterized protein LOC130934113 n=1 Tax=Arachis stenosperma TaxID=217475 RepID=UPI0025ACE234|nr:uncharacterized protein LOC130934113 [Arachis stenosperma]
MNKDCSALIQPGAPTKKEDPGSFHIPCAIGETMIDKGLCDLGTSINVRPFSLMKRLQINELTPTDVIIRLADKTQRQAIGVVENMLIKVGNYYLPTDFVVLEMDENPIYPIILGRPLLATARALIDVERGELVLRIHDEQLTFNVFKPSQESDHDNRELMEEPTKEALMQETSSEAKTIQIEASLVGKPCAQEEPHQKGIQKKPEPPEPCKTSNKNSLEEESVESKIALRETRKKVPRRWRNKKIPTEDFSPGDEVISTYFPTIPPHLPTIPSQLPPVYTINKIMSLEHMELINKANGHRFTARGEDFKHYQPP